MKELNIPNSATSLGKVNVKIVTNGFTKMLVISDSYQHDDWVAIEEQKNDKDVKFKFLNFEFFQKAKEEINHRVLVF